MGSGLAVTYRTVGDLDAAGSGAQLAIHRIAQEARTNTLKHASTASTAAVTAAAHADRGASARQAAEPEAAVIRSAGTSAMPGPPWPGCGPSLHG